jgi:hypothetical protein
MDSDSDDEVRDELPFLCQDNERLGLLLDNCHDMLREAKKMRKELRASLEDARTRVSELETQNLDAKLKINSLKASPVVSDEVEYARTRVSELMGWSFGHEPQLRIMIETYKRQDGEGLGANKVGEGSGENIPEPPKTHHKNAFPT